MLWNSFSQKESAWRQQKHNRTLRLQLEALRAEVEDYTLTLQRNQWDDICDRMKGSLGMRSTWQLLRHLLDPTTSKVEQRQRMTPLLHKYPGSDEDLLKEAQTKYLPEFPTQPLPDYAEQAEEAAIALALATTPRPRTIISDSKAAILNYAKGYVSTPAQAILRTLKAQPLESAVSLVWTPAHSGLCGNELAHSTARGFTTRAEGAQLRTAEIRSARDSLVNSSSALAAFSIARALAHSRRWWPVSAYSLQILAGGVSVPPHVVPAHRDYGEVGPETVDDGRCPDLFLAPLRPFDLRSIQRAKKTPARRHHGRNRRAKFALRKKNVPPKSDNESRSANGRESDEKPLPHDVQRPTGRDHRVAALRPTKNAVLRDIPILCLLDTWTDVLLQVDGYTGVVCNKGINSRAGGVAIYAKNGYEVISPYALTIAEQAKCAGTLNYGNEKRRPFVNVKRRMLNYDNVKQRRFENVEQQNLRFGTVKFNVNVRSARRNPTFENGKPRWFVNVEQQNLSCDCPPGVMRGWKSNVTENCTPASCVASRSSNEASRAVVQAGEYAVRRRGVQPKLVFVQTTTHRFIVSRKRTIRCTPSRVSRQQPQGR
ncbi:hypothetical protein HPB47_004936 [Ixodes persulcatus]|uniref:Uncharacterized protein n=1 Tax=Ixodes persulcatus TaxID=34615 RepID=A0AC60PFN6_IXOPE|nr:hypothetical protein HPB47_004936 [Ixodes persulcatus]